MYNTTVTYLYNKARDYQEQYCDLVNEIERIQNEIDAREKRSHSADSQISKIQTFVFLNYKEI